MSCSVRASDSRVTHFRLEEHSVVPAQWRNPPGFTITRLESPIGLHDRVVKVSAVPALLVSISLRPIVSERYQLWVGDKLMRTPYVAAFRVNVVDFDSHPSCWAGAAFDYVHYHVPREALDDLAADLGFDRVAAYRLAVTERDLVITQLTKNILPFVEGSGALSRLAVDHFQLALGAHLIQQYGETRSGRRVFAGGLGNWQKRRAEELLRENLDGSLNLSLLAAECRLSVSHFARAFKVTFGMSAHQWLIQRRIERALELLANSEATLADIALQSGFGDQAAFTRTFHRVVGATPGLWRREHGRHLARTEATNDKPGRNQQERAATLA